MQQRVYRISALASTRKSKLGKGKDHQGLIPVSPATIWRWVKNGEFPAPFKLGQNVSVWDADQIDTFLAQKREAKQ